MALSLKDKVIANVDLLDGIDSTGFLVTATMSNTAYGAGWDGDTTHVPTKNAVYDAINALPATHDSVTIGTPANGLSLSGQEISLGLASTSTTGALSDTDWDTFNGKQDALTFGIANTNAVRIDMAGVADNDYAKFTANGLEGRSYSEVLSDIGAQAALTFGIANTNAVKIDSASVAVNEYARFTANGLESRSTSEVLSDIGAQPADATLTSLAAVAATAANDFIVATGADAYTKKTLAETKTILGIPNDSIISITQITGFTLSTSWVALTPLTGFTPVDHAVYAFYIKVTGTVTTTVIEATGQFVYKATGTTNTANNELLLAAISQSADNDKKIYLRQVCAGSADAWTLEIASDTDLGASVKIDMTFRRLI